MEGWQQALCLALIWALGSPSVAVNILLMASYCLHLPGTPSQLRGPSLKWGRMKGLILAPQIPWCWCCCCNRSEPRACSEPGGSGGSSCHCCRLFALV